MSESHSYLNAVESLRELFLNYPMRAEMSAIHVSVNATGKSSIMVRLHATKPVVVAAGIVEWRQTLARGDTWSWRTPNGMELHFATTGYAPECTDIPITVFAGPVPHDCRLDHALDPDESDRLDDDALHRWLGNEITNDWPFPTAPDPIGATE